MQGQTLRQVILTEYAVKDSERRGLSIYTIRGKSQSLERFLKWLKDRPLTAKVCNEYTDYLRSRKNQPESINLAVRTLQAAIRWLYKGRYIPKDFAGELVKPRLKRKEVQIVPAERAQEIILAGTKPGEWDHKKHCKVKADMRAALLFILRTGLRMRELMDLRPCDFNLETKTYTVQSKSGNQDILPIPEDMIPEIRNRLKDKRVFPVCSKTMNLALRRGCKKLGVTVNVHVHTLRHIFCTSLGLAGLPVQKTSRLMRHSSIKLTDAVYSHYCIEDLSQALNAYHPLISRGLTKEQAFEIVESAVRATAVSKDSRFQLTVDKTDDEITIKLKV